MPSSQLEYLGTKQHQISPEFKNQPSRDSDNINSLLQSSQAQEDRFEALTRQLQEERETVSRRLAKPSHSDHHHLQQQQHDPNRPSAPASPPPLSDTASMNSITSTDDSFHYHGHDPRRDESGHAPSYLDDLDHLGGSPGNSSKMSSHLLDSCLRELEDRGTLNSGYIRDSGTNMDYMQEDPYSGHRFAPQDPYYSGGYEGGYPSNTSFDRQSDHSIHSDRNRMAKNYSDVPNGGPYSSSSNLYPADQSQLQGMRASPQPQRDGSYAGSRGSFQGPPEGDPYGGEPIPRYNGGVHYPEDTMGYQGQPDSRGPMDPQYYDQDGSPMYNDQPSFQNDSMYPDNQPGDLGPEGYRQAHNRSNGPLDDQYNDSYQQQQESFHDPRHDSYQGGLPLNDQYDPNRPPSAQQFANYQDQDPYSDMPRQRGSFDPVGSQSYPSGNYNDQGPPPGHPYDSFRDDQGQGDMYGDDAQRRYDGLPPVRADPFADDPFREQHSRDGNMLSPQEDPYYRGSSPAGGPEPVPFDDRGQPYDDRAPPYDDRGPPYDDRGPPYDEGQGPQFDERDGPDPYSQSAPRYTSDYPQNDPYYPEEEAARRMEQLSIGAPPVMEGRRTPSKGYGQGLSNRYPDLQEVIDFLNSNDDSIKASAAAHLQHITYMDDSVKAKTRSLGGIRPLIGLLSHELVEVHKNACGALQNLSYGKTNNDNKREIKNEGGIPELIRLLRKTDQDDVKESVTGVLWNLSSCEDLKQSIIEDGLTVLVNNVILRYSGYGAGTTTSSQMPWTAVCRNTTGILRNVSSAGFDARKRLRECRGLVNALIHILLIAADDETSNDIDNKVVENTVCILRNLSYRIQEVVDPDFYKKRTLPRQVQQGKGKGGKGGEGPGCFGSKSSKAKNSSPSKSGYQQNNPPPQLPPSSTEYRALWGSEVHSLYSIVLKRCTNPITMEAAAGAIQNLTACDWQPAVESRAMVRKEKGLPLLVDLLSAESDRVVCATATALRNLAIDEKNKELVGKYAIRQLVSRLPRDNRLVLPDDTICAVVATLYEVVKDNQDFALALVTEDGLSRLMHINNSEGRYLSRTLKFTSTLLKTLWGYKSLHVKYAEQGYGQADFTTSKAYARQDGSRPPDVTRTPTSSNHTTPYNTLSRPMSGQGYDDSTLTPAKAQQMQSRGGGGGGYYTDSGSRAGGLNYNPGINRSNASLHDNRGQDRLNYSRDRIPQEDVPLNDIGPGYAPLDEPRPHRTTKPPVGGVPLFPNLAPAEPVGPDYGDQDPHGGSEPLYAQVNKGSRRRGEPNFNRDGVLLSTGGSGDQGGGADSWV